MTENTCTQSSKPQCHDKAVDINDDKKTYAVSPQQLGCHNKDVGINGGREHLSSVHST